jgi:ligand-binding sensor domain-containing protein
VSSTSGPLRLAILSAVGALALGAAPGVRDAPKAAATDAPVTVPLLRRGYQATVPGAVDLAVDRHGNVWLPTLEPDAFLRLGDDGQVAEKITFTRPQDVHVANEYDRRFTVLRDGAFALGRHRFDRLGRPGITDPFRQSVDVAAGPHGTLVRLSDEGVDQYARDGGHLGRRSQGGTGPGRIEDARAVAVDRFGRVLVAERKGLQLLDREGSALRSTRLPAATTTSITWISDVAIDRNGTSYVLQKNPEALVVLDPHLRHLHTELGLGGDTIALDAAGRLYTLGVFDDVVRQWTVPASLANLAPAPSKQASPPPVTGSTPAAATLVASPRLPFRVHSSSRRVQHVARDPQVRDRLWLSTEGGLVRYDVGGERWKKWTLADGLPGRPIVARAAGGKVYLLLYDYGAAVFDPASETFHRLALKAAGLERVSGVAIEPEPGDDGTLWWVLVDGVLRQRVGEDTWSFFRAPDFLRAGRAVRGGVVVTTDTAVWELVAGSGAWRRIVDVNVLDRAAGKRIVPDAKVAMRALAVSRDGATIWVGTASDGVLRVDRRSGRAGVEPGQRDDCRWAYHSLVEARGGRFLLGRRAVTRASGQKTCPIDAADLRGDVRAVVADDENARLWLATDEGLVSYDVPSARLAQHAPPWAEPPGTWAGALAAVGGRLWVGFVNAPLGVLDPRTGSWGSAPGYCGANSFEPAADGDRVLVLATDCNGATRLAWFQDDAGLASAELTDWRRVWDLLTDVHHDARGLWGLGELAGKDTSAFGILRRDGEVELRMEALRHDISPRQMAADPMHPDVAWLLSAQGELHRLDLARNTHERVRPRAWHLRTSAGRYLWMELPAARIDLASGEVRELPLEGRLFPDTASGARSGNLVWTLQDRKVALHDIASGATLFEQALPSGDLYRDPVRLGGSLWLGSLHGLLEIPLPERWTAAER